MGGMQEMNAIVTPEQRGEAVKALFERINACAEKLKKVNKAVVVTHHDCDGLTSGSIVVKALQREGVDVSTITLKQLYTEDVQRLKNMHVDASIFTDFGSSYIPTLKQEFTHDFYIIDHHQRGNGDHEGHMNPMEFGLDGGTEISSAGIAYYLATTLSPKNKELASIGVVGACGDMQDSRSNGLVGLNKQMVNEGIEAGVLDVKTDLRLYGRISRPLAQYLMFSTSPILPELTANKDQCMKFLENLDIPLHDDGKYRSYEDLDSGEKKILSTAILMHLHEHNTPEWKLNELIGDVYTLTKEDRYSPLRDAKEFSTVLNACGRNGQSTIGFQVCLGDREDYYARAMGLLQEHRRNLAEGIQLMQQEGLSEYNHFYFFDAEKRIKDSIVGIVAGMLYGSGGVKTDKPIVAFARHEDGSIKVSARATSELVRNGVNLGLALRETCQALGKTAEGGGHRIAAGCRIEVEQSTVFLQNFDQKLGEQRGDAFNPARATH